MTNVKNRAIYFLGDKVILSGEKFMVYGGWYYKGVYITGHKKGELVSIDIKYAHQQLLMMQEN